MSAWEPSEENVHLPSPAKVFPECCWAGTVQSSPGLPSLAGSFPRFFFSPWLPFLDGECCRERLNPKASAFLWVCVEILLLTRKLACDALLLCVRV